jgi:deazaflavin-dependent oxidoreductase (nitroreductase family)
LYRATGGRLGRRFVNADILLLTTTGRKSGAKHTVPLIYLRDEDRVVVVASYAGRPDPPDWYKNLLADPVVEVETPEGKWVGRARTADPDERAVWWPRAVAVYKPYADYQTRTDRVIPIVFIEPVGES